MNQNKDKIICWICEKELNESTRAMKVWFSKFHESLVSTCNSCLYKKMEKWRKSKN